MVTPKYHVFVCTSCRIDGTQKGLCATKQSTDIIKRLMEEIEDRDLSGDVMVNNTGCFGICSRGPVMVVYPEGTWYGNLTPDDIEAIVEGHFENGEPVKELMI